MLRIVFSLFCALYLFLVLGLDSKGITNTLKRYYVAMECADVVMHQSFETPGPPTSGLSGVMRGHSRQIHSILVPR